VIHLPIEHILQDLRSLLQNTNTVILTAEPGAGKTTVVPVSLLDEPWLNSQKIIMLEPRRIAAIRSAEYMAEQRGERTGSTIGYRIRGENTVGKDTRLEVVTEGILTRMLQNDASLPGVGLLIFDEFHERSIHADLGLALARDVQTHLRPDLRIIVMSATIDTEAVSSMLDNAPVLSCKGRTYPVSVRYLPQMLTGPIENAVANAVFRSLKDDEGDILVFLPGQREIIRTESLLRQKEFSASVSLHLLFGEATSEQQRNALRPASAGSRKVILATNIAETSLTIDGVRVVIDSGLARSAVFDPRRGMTGLVTIPVSQASADQRKGRAGRQSEGVCYRLWQEHHHVNLQPFALPEIITSDLAPLAMELALWGDGEARTVKFLDPPPEAHLAQSRELLRYLGALDGKGNLTDHGREMASLPVHPRIAHMLLRGKERSLGGIACDLAALLDDRDAVRGKSESDIDLHLRFTRLYGNGSAGVSIPKRIREQSDRLRRTLGLSRMQEYGKIDSLGLLLALAYPDRIGKRRTEERYQLTGNMVASLHKGSALSRHEFIAVGEVDGAGSDIRIFLAEPLTKEEIFENFSGQLTEKKELRWDDKSRSVLSRIVTRLGTLELSDRSVTPESDEAQVLIIGAIQEHGLSVLPWDTEAEDLRRRSEWLRRQGLVTDWPDLSDAFLLSTMNEWLAPFLNGITRFAQLTKLSMTEILRSLFPYQRLKELERMAPTHLTVPTGSSIPIDYSSEQPVLAVRLQEMFGETETPTVAGGARKVLLHLLSPARRPLAVTQDLPSFWKQAYQEVRKDMHGQYPKHYWPEDPLAAEPTRRTKKWMDQNPR
jgi:ATP-dependent helicase HrpB